MEGCGSRSAGEGGGGREWGNREGAESRGHAQRPGLGALGGCSSGEGVLREKDWLGLEGVGKGRAREAERDAQGQRCGERHRTAGVPWLWGATAERGQGNNQGRGAMDPFTPGDRNRFCFLTVNLCEPVHDHLCVYCCRRFFRH